LAPPVPTTPAIFKAPAPPGTSAAIPLPPPPKTGFITASSLVAKPPDAPMIAQPEYQYSYVNDSIFAQ